MSTDDGVEVVELSEEEGREAFDRACRKTLGVPAEEFVTEHDAGTAEDRWGHLKYIRLRMLLPFWRREPIDE